MKKQYSEHNVCISSENARYTNIVNHEIYDECAMYIYLHCSVESREKINKKLGYANSKIQNLTFTKLQEFAKMKVEGSTFYSEKGKRCQYELVNVPYALRRKELNKILTKTFNFVQPRMACNTLIQSELTKENKLQHIIKNEK